MTTTQRQRASHHTELSNAAAMHSASPAAAPAAAAASDATPDTLDTKKSTDPALRQKILTLCALLVLLLLWSLGQDWTARPLILPGTRPRAPPLAVVPGAPLPGESSKVGSNAANAGVPALAGLTLLSLSLPANNDGATAETQQQHHQQYAVLIPSSIHLDSGNSRSSSSVAAVGARFPLLFAMHAGLTAESACESWRAQVEIRRWIVVCPSMLGATIDSLHAVLDHVLAEGSTAHALGRIVDPSAVLALAAGSDSDSGALLQLWIRMLEALPNHWTAAACLHCDDDGSRTATLLPLDSSAVAFRARYYSSRSVALVSRSSASALQQSAAAASSSSLSEWLQAQFGFSRVETLRAETSSSDDQRDRELIAQWWLDRL